MMNKASFVIQTERINEFEGLKRSVSFILKSLLTGHLFMNSFVFRKMKVTVFVKALQYTYSG
jgi:hypothetical protein